MEATLSQHLSETPRARSRDVDYALRTTRAWCDIRDEVTAQFYEQELSELVVVIAPQSADGSDLALGSLCGQSKALFALLRQWFELLSCSNCRMFNEHSTTRKSCR